ncbi:hypothetical protein KZZ52_58525 [Dactylosporangium sp. AC04546]|uniref:hypothetical protein n=1 Tax=Dactylosporangium sp. AC04546 TaxID=2862460 RepID=UPI001EDE41BE|nr:hypothetical protein [Dactylosporangium sp. AC04546]WVK83592.1 hypothetical protein KZZ52_58525 [Dactylosporangium sp. AC04546]
MRATPRSVLFLSVCQVTAGVAAVQTGGWVQAVFAVFAVVFPFAALVVPAAKARRSRAAEDALPGSFNWTFTTAEAVVRATIEETLPRYLQETDRQRSWRIVREAVAAGDAELRTRFIEVNLSGIDPARWDTLKIPVADRTTVSDVLDQVWQAIRQHVPAGSLNERWSLVDAATGAPLRDVGRAWAQRRIGSPVDSRLLIEAGIRPGARWVATKI